MNSTDFPHRSPMSRIRHALRQVKLPTAVSAFERSYLARMNRIATYFFYAHLPLFVALAAVNGTGVVSGALLTLAVLVVPFVAHRTLASERLKSLTHGFTAMCMGGVLVHLGQGPVQIEMHFYFFSVLAMLALFANPMVIVVAAATVALHHLALWYVAPASVFNYDAPLWVVLVHAAFVVLETFAACFIARNFFDNVIGLERKVEERTAEVRRKNREMRLVLDTVRQGLVTVDLQGTVRGESSRIFEEWFGPVPQDARLADVLASHDRAFGEWLALSLDSLGDGFMPIEVVLDQFPRELGVDGRHFAFEYEPILDASGQPEQLLVAVSDVTSEIEHAEQKQRQMETLQVFEAILTDRQSLLDFFEEGSRVVRSLRDDLSKDQPTAKRHVHTLKGNSSVFGLHSVACICHGVEDALAESDPLVLERHVAELEQRWAELDATVNQILGESARDAIVIEPAEYEALLERIVDGEPHDRIARMLVDLSLEPTESRLERLAEHARILAERLEKGDLEVELDCGGLRVERERFKEFWGSLTHVLRNAVDHGIEPPDERSATGKGPSGRLQLRTFEANGQFVVEVRDDGRGIDWDALAARARAHGLGAADRGSLVDALFAQGVSTRDAVTETSGRGVGLAAVRAACESLGGHVVVETEPGSFTSFQFRFPASIRASYPLAA